jgi:hypothetical protein
MQTQTTQAGNPSRSQPEARETKQASSPGTSRPDARALQGVAPALERPWPTTTGKREQVDLVDKVVVEQPPDQGAAAVHLQFASRLGFQLPDSYCELGDTPQIGCHRISTLDHKCPGVRPRRTSVSWRGPAYYLGWASS